MALLVRTPVQVRAVGTCQGRSQDLVGYGQQERIDLRAVCFGPLLGVRPASAGTHRTPVWKHVASDPLNQGSHGTAQRS